MLLIRFLLVLRSGLRPGRRFRETPRRHMRLLMPLAALVPVLFDDHIGPIVPRIRCSVIPVSIISWCR
jgi:hypothetical protein